jgi:Cu-Zn family superoxide dismutase
MNTDKRHGAPVDAERMAGDLGNILADETGAAAVDLSDSVVTLLGPHSVIGRSLVIYAGEDDRGRGGHENSQQTGNPGPRIAVGVIGLSL